jgi:DNA-directed RNA polymerase beta' subunit
MMFPEDFAFHNEAMTKKRSGTAVMGRVFATYGADVDCTSIADDLMRLGFSYGTFAGISTGMDDYTLISRVSTSSSAVGEDKASAVSDQYEDGLITEEERYRLTVQYMARCR